MRGAIILIFFVACASHADPLQLTRWEKLSESLRLQLKHAREATITFDSIQGTDIEACSGTFLSNEGHLLTANHCISSCLANARKNKAQEDGSLTSPALRWITHNQNEPQQIFTHDGYVNYLNSDKPDESFNIENTDINELQGLECNFRINGKDTKVKYLGGGIGMLWPMLSQRLSAKRLLPDWTAFVEKGFGPGGDFAVLKAELTQTPCLSLSKISAKPGELLQVLSATQLLGYKTDKERQGQTAFYSAGTEASETLALLRPELPLKIYRHAYVNSDYGSSGSGIIGEDYTIKGVLTQANKYFKNDSTIQEYSSFIDAQFIEKILISNWNVQLPSCDPNLKSDSTPR